MEQMTSVYELRPSFILLVHKLHHSGLVEKRTCLVVISLLGTVEKMTGDVDRALKGKLKAFIEVLKTIVSL